MPLPPVRWRWHGQSCATARGRPSCHHPPSHDGESFYPLKYQLFECQTDDRNDHDAGQHHIGVEELACPEYEPAEPPRYGREHLDPDQDAPRLGKSEPQPGEDIWQCAWQDDVA